MTLPIICGPKASGLERLKWLISCWLLALLRSNFPDHKGIDELGRLTLDIGAGNEDRNWTNILTFGLFGSNGQP